MHWWPTSSPWPTPRVWTVRPCRPRLGCHVAWVLAARHPERIRTLTAVSVRTGAFGAALGGAIPTRPSALVHRVFRQEGVAERALLGEDESGDGLRAMFVASGLAADAAEIASSWPPCSSPVLSPRSQLYRAMSADAVGTWARSPATLYVWSTQDIALGRQAAEATASG